MTVHVRPPRPVLLAPLFGLVALAIAWATGGLSPSLWNPDEGAHYVNALFLGDWVRAGLPSPMTFARDFYAHFPRLSIGHWPPGWYLLQAPLFAAVRPSPLGALLLSAIVAGLPAGAILWAFDRLRRPWLGAGVASAYVLSPLVAEAARHVLLDQPVTLVVALAVVAWFRASERPSWGRMLPFAALAAAAPLVKGNGALVALIPAIDMALTGRWALLRRPALWAAALLALLVVAPWYWLSFRISAGGFNYEPGLAYAFLALRANLTGLYDNLGPAGLALAVLGAAWSWRREEAGRLARLAVAVVVATLLFQSAVPVAIEPRYVAPLLPWAYLLAGLGSIALFELTRRKWLAGLAGAAAVAPALLALWSLPPKPDLRAPELARRMVDAGGLWLVDARAGGEGAVIAAAAYADRGERRVWVARASQWLSASDFMGRGYRLTARTSAEASAELDRLGASGVMSIADRDRPAYPHSRVLGAALHSGDYALTAERFTAGQGSVLVARRSNAVSPHPELLASGSGSANVSKMSEALR